MTCLLCVHTAHASHALTPVQCCVYTVQMQRCLARGKTLDELRGVAERGDPRYADFKRDFIDAEKGARGGVGAAATATADAQIGSVDVATSEPVRAFVTAGGMSMRSSVAVPWAASAALYGSSVCQEC